MQLYFYNCSDDYRRVNKNTGNPVWAADGVTINMNQIEPVDLIRPDFIVSNNPSMPLTFNYAYCPDLGRYYFITEQKAVTGNKRIISCLVDVRKSFLNALIPVTVVRNEFATNSNVPDNNFPVDPNLHDFRVILLDNDIFSDHYRVIRTVKTSQSEAEE